MQYAKNVQIGSVMNQLYIVNMGLILSVRILNNDLEVSATPFVFDKETCYFYILELTLHTNNISVNPNTGAHIIANKNKIKIMNAKRTLFYPVFEPFGLLVTIKKIPLFKAILIEKIRIVGFAKAYLFNPKIQEVT